jgi:hypothetical protein
MTIEDWTRLMPQNGAAMNADKASAVNIHLRNYARAISFKEVG